MSTPPRKSWMVELAPAAPAPVTRQARRAASAPPPTPAGAVTGLGLTSDRMRAQMVERLRAAGIADESVLAAMGAVPRHRFVDEGLASRAYEDSSLPIGHGQTISQPWVVARMAELIRGGRKPVRLLEVGTGCGYQAAVLALLAGEVYSIERIRALHDRARANLRPLRMANLRLMHGDGMAGVPSAAPFDGMAVAAAADAVPRALLDQLAIGGRLVAPLGGAHQVLCLIVRTGPDTWSRRQLDPVRFVPLKPGIV